MTERNEIFRDIQTVLAGHSETEILAALIGSLVVAIGVMSDDLNHARATIDSLPADMKRALLTEWPKLRRHRTVAGLKRDVERAAG